MKTVAIIGGSGFIGSHITKRFLTEGYRVRVSSTDILNKSKYEHLLTMKNANNLTIRPIDLLDIGSIKSFIEGCNIIIHAGTPFQLDVKDPENELIRPTVNGTNNFLDELKFNKKLEKVVFIASVASWNTSFPMNPESYAPDHIFSEKDTPYFGENDHPYAQAKYFADQAVRKFLKENTNLTYEVISISPVMVIGNALSQRQDSTSMGLQYLFKNKIAPNPFIEMMFANDVSFAMVDVKDVATATFQATLLNGNHGKNYLMGNETYKISDISLMLNHKEPISPARYLYNNDLIKKDLSINFTSAKETFLTC